MFAFAYPKYFGMQIYYYATYLDTAIYLLHLQHIYYILFMVYMFLHKFTYFGIDIYRNQYTCTFLCILNPVLIYSKSVYFYTSNVVMLLITARARPLWQFRTLI